MSTSSLVRDRRQSRYEPENDEGWHVAAPPPGKDKEGFAERWNSKDPLDELIDQLVVLGRVQEANVVERILSRANEVSEDELVRGLVSANWAADWDSEEDSIYDE